MQIISSRTIYKSEGRVLLGPAWVTWPLMILWLARPGHVLPVWRIGEVEPINVRPKIVGKRKLLGLQFRMTCLWAVVKTRLRGSSDHAPAAISSSSLPILSRLLKTTVSLSLSHFHIPNSDFNYFSHGLGSSSIDATFFTVIHSNTRPHCSF